MPSVGRTEESPSNTEPSSSTRRKHFKACLRCRKRKVRCPGGDPCANCLRTEQDCHYDAAKKVFVSEDYLRRLERRVSSSTRHIHGTAAVQSDSVSVYANDFAEDDVANPLAHNTVSSTTDSVGGHHFVGPSSTWGFAWRVRRLLASLPSSGRDGYQTEVDDSTYTRLNEPRLVEPQDAYSLPKETKERYLSNYEFHVAPVWHFADLEMILQELQSQQGTHPTGTIPLLRRIQFNLVMAIGKLLEHAVKRESSPSESYFRFAHTAMETMNESNLIATAPILVTQNLTLMSFYLHAINMRNDAYILIGKATRVAFTQGLHRLPGLALEGNNGQEGRVRLWWSLYALDITLTSLMGGPVSAHEDDITTREPVADSESGNSEAIIHCTKVARLMAVVLSEIYSVRSRDRATFGRSISKVLDGAYQALENMPVNHRIDFDAPASHVSRTSATLYLMTYQSLIVALRPVLFHLVELEVERISSHGLSSAPVPSTSLRQLLRKMVDAATRSMRILSSLMYQSQLQAFLTFDVTAAFSSAVILLLADFISTKSLAEASHVSEALQILGELSDLGNVSAQKRFHELKNLQRDLKNALDAYMNQQLEHPAADKVTGNAPDTEMIQHENCPGLVDSTGNLGNTDSILSGPLDPLWGDFSTQMLLDESLTEGFESFFAQPGQFSDFIPLQEQINLGQ